MFNFPESYTQGRVSCCCYGWEFCFARSGVRCILWENLGLAPLLRLSLVGTSQNKGLRRVARDDVV